MFTFFAISYLDIAAIHKDITAPLSSEIFVLGCFIETTCSTFVNTSAMAVI
jgi:hypothetical protein